MKRDLGRRLRAVEKRRGGPAAAMRRRIEAMSYEELVAELLALQRGEPSPSGMSSDPRAMTDEEIARCIAELELLDAKWEASGGRPWLRAAEARNPLAGAGSDRVRTAASGAGGAE